MEIKIIRKKIKDNEYVYSLHAEIERKEDELTFHQIEKALPPKFIDPWTRGKKYGKEKM